MWSIQPSLTLLCAFRPFYHCSYSIHYRCVTLAQNIGPLLQGVTMGKGKKKEITKAKYIKYFERNNNGCAYLGLLYMSNFVGNK